MTDASNDNQHYHPNPLQYLKDVQLDEKTITRRSPEIEHEKKVAIFDLLQRNLFEPSDGLTGPYILNISVADGKRLIFSITHAISNEHLRSNILSLSPFRKLIRDYFQICESYFDAIKKLTPNQIETIDMARRGIHNEGAELLRERLDGKITMDLHTARRLFTLICVLHIKN